MAKKRIGILNRTECDGNIAGLCPKRSENRGKASSIPKVVMGAAILLAGLYMLWLAF